jgi:uncharacterized lipoprotein YddW (UPF0748 family)
MHRLDEVNYLRDHVPELVAILEQYDWGSFDAFGEAVRYGRRIGVEVHAWLSVNEDDHGYGWTSRYTREHPGSRWVRRDGRPFRSQQSFAFPEVREYKLALLKEVMAYCPAGVFFDWIRTGDIRDGPQTDSDGVAIHGYERPNVEQFRRLYGVDPQEVANSDPRWVSLRAEPQTAFMRDACALIRSTAPGCPISAMVQHSFGYRARPDVTPYDGSLRGLLADVAAWAAEGLIDAVVAAGYYREGGTPERAWREMQEATGGKIGVWVFGWLRHDDFVTCLSLAERLGAPELLLWESDYVGLSQENQEFVKAMSGYARG